MEEELYSSSRWYLFSPVVFSQYKVTLPLLLRFASGRLIDLGCGRMPFRKFLMRQTSVYDSLDIHPCVETTYVADVQNMPMIIDQSYDTALCLEVLEHVPEPLQALREINRILKPNGVLIISVPHLSRLHEEPHDYYRFTKYALRHILESAGFQIVALEKRGGLFSFLGHQISTLVLGLIWNVRFVRSTVWFLDSWLITRACYGLDQVLDRAGLFAIGYSVVACKTGTLTSS
jgi:SAM-dependent methyltransferase